MKTILFTTALLCGLALAAQAGTVVVTFESLAGQGSCNTYGCSGLVPDGYGGINWAGQWSYFDYPLYPYTPHSGSTRVFTNDYGTQGQVLFSFQTPEIFDGAWFAGGPDETVYFNLYDAGALVDKSSSILVSSDVVETNDGPVTNPVFLASGYSGPVDQVGVWAEANGMYVMDDVTYHNNSNGPAVPEPGSLFLMGAGLVAGLIYVFFRRRAAALAMRRY